jgi:hypothetical protein
MSETKYDKHFITELNYPDAQKNPSPPVAWKNRILYLDDRVLKGAPYMSCCWYTPGEIRASDATEAHTHDCDEVLAFIGTNSDVPSDLGGEIELWIDGEKHLINKSCLVFIPKGLAHCPMLPTKIDRPIFHFSTIPSVTYTKLPVEKK